MDRVRSYIQRYPQRLVAVTGELVCAGALDAPYFHFLVLEGRSLTERHPLLSGFPDLVAGCLGAERSLVRGGCWSTPSEDWAIGGVPSSVVRAKDSEALAAAGEANAVRHDSATS